MRKGPEELKGLIAKRLGEINFPKEPRDLYLPLSYFLGLGGKRIRPVLTLLVKNLYGQETSEDVDFACGIELFHNFTLLHDDIMDNAPIRRGKDSVHTKWNPNIAILAGDALMIKAYQLLGSSKIFLEKMYEEFNQTALNVCEGQQFDMSFESSISPGRLEYLNMIQLKTATLIGFSTWAGGVLGGAKSGDLEKLKEIGTEAGIGFQLMDDYLDAFGNPKNFGKKLGGDISEGKKTILWILALEKSNVEQRAWLEKMYSQTSRNQAEIDTVIKTFKTLEVDRLALEMMEEKFKITREKISSLDGIKDSKNELMDYINSLMARQS